MKTFRTRKFQNIWVALAKMQLICGQGRIHPGKIGLGRRRHTLELAISVLRLKAIDLRMFYRPFRVSKLLSDQLFLAIHTWRRVRRSRKHPVRSIAKTRTDTQSRAISTKITLKSRKATSRQVTKQLRYCCSYIFARAGSSNHVSQGVNAGPHGHSFFKTLTHRLSRRYVTYQPKFNLETISTTGRRYFVDRVLICRDSPALMERALMESVAVRTYRQIIPVL